MIMMQVMIAVPLMYDRGKRAIPVGYSMRRQIVISPFVQRGRSQSAEIVDSAASLLPDGQRGNGVDVGQLVGIVEIVVKALVGSCHLNLGLILLIDQRSQVLLHSDNLSHGTSRAYGWFFSHGLKDGYTIPITKPIGILGRFSQPRCLGIFTKEPQSTVRNVRIRMTRQISKWIELKERITSIHHHNPRILIVMLQPNPVPFVAKRCHHSTLSWILSLAEDLAIRVVDPSIDFMESTHLKDIHTTRLHDSSACPRYLIFPQTIHITVIDHQIGLRL
mmetsp:Transcript_7527/g.12549  ORF Transcript_7527/g.12549 Transcript_7527/m.12549 type:complete len:276 (+) Transcript_7527:118-945(+)